MASNYIMNDVSLHCKKCCTKLAKREILMLARMPPSQQHLAVKEGKEDEAYAKVAKEENSKGGKSARYCPFIIRCRECRNHVGNVTYVASKLLVCYKVDNLYLSNGVEKTEMKKLKEHVSFLQNLGVEVIKYLPSEVTCQSIQSNEPMKYCDISGLTYISHDIDSLTDQIPRKYQRELFLSAMRGNTLVYLPTGSGKTLVAAMVFSCMKQLNPRKFMVFIVDRIPLAYQQSAYFKSQLPCLRVETLTGEMVQFKKKTVHQALADRMVDILVLTHQIFLDSLAVENSTIRLLDISVLVFDEAHHCTSGHPYNKIMNDFYEKVTPDSFKPLVLGLTASPAGEITTERTIEKLQKLLKNLHCNITMPVESDDLIAHVNAPNTSYDEVATTDVRQIVLETLIMEHIKYLQTNHIESAPGYQQALAGLFVFSSHFRGALRNLIDRCHGDNSQAEALIIGQHMMRLLSVIDISQVLCYKDALVYMNDCIHSIIQATSPCQSALKKLIGTKQTFLELKNHAAEEVKEDYPMSDRYRCLENRIHQFICRVEEDPTSRGIIFVRMRKTAYKLCEKLRSKSHVSRLLNPAAFVGHGDGNYDGMAWKDEQEVLLRDFRLGAIKLLVSTSVLEEGLDVPVCNLVIRFEGAATLRSLVQSRGRASRRAGSEFVVICSEKERHAAMSLVVKEENMRYAVTNVMDNEVAKSQALEFKCEIKRPDLIPREVKEVENSPDVMRYTPIVTVVVQVFEKQESHEQTLKNVTNNLESAFNVEPTKLLPTESLSGLRVHEDDGSSQIALILKQKDNMRQEFRSKDEFISNISEVWCNKMTNEELLNIWLHPLLPRKFRKLIEPFHILPATSLFLGTLVTRCHFQYEWPSEPVLKKVIMRFDHSYNMLTVFCVMRRRNYKLEIRYDEFEDFVLVDSNTTNNEMIRVFFSVRHPPRVYQEVDHVGNDNGNHVDNNGDNDSDNDDDNDGDNSVQDEGFDVSDISDNDSESESFSTDDEYPDVVRNFHNRSIPNYADDVSLWERVVDVQGGEKAWGECFTYCFTIPPKESTLLRSLLTTLDWRYGKKAFCSWVKNTYGRFPQVNIPDELDFDVRYTFDSILISHPSVRGRLDESRLVVLLQNRNPNVVVACLEKLRNALERNPLCNPQKTLERLLTGEIKLESKQNQNQVPSHCAIIKRVVITPTRVLLYPSEIMVKNRVLRHYETDDFLCVSIREENLSKLSIGRGSIDLLLDNINQVLNNGLTIARKTFKFLASSNSQLRNHSCWFMGPSIPPEDVRRWMGDFTHIRCVATLMARMGQCFSTSLDTAGVQTPDDEMYSEEDDVMTSDKEYCFSDGVGRISEELAVEVAQNLGKPFTPSAFQVRVAGYKGVLACDPTLVGRRASFRPSMRKFESNHRRLEVTHTSRPQAVYLNHQVIMLLSNLEVPDEAFIDLQKEMLDKLAGMLVEETYAITFLGNGSKMGMSYRTLSNGGVRLTTEPFFKSMLVAMHRNHIHELLSRSRILLPAEEARLMMGVMDEKGVLKPGQVFVQYSAVSKAKDEEHDFNLNDKRCLTGPVVVTRNPCLHPGDVRQFEAVKAPSLSHLVDCIVFPRLGLRPHPNEMSGGDLDGDLYFVCWKQSLLPNKPDFQPMDYKALPKEEEPQPITSSHMTKFVVDYIRSDQLGVIDNTHKALADQEEEGIQSDICLHLAEIHSLAVDAPKTGMWPKMPKTNLKKYPDFMMKSDKLSYPSENVLGKLYRRCQKFKDTTSENCNQKMRIDKSFLLPGRDRYLRNAKVVYQKYRDKMEALMRLYGIHSEAEIFTGCFLKLRNRLPREKTKIADIVSEIVLGMRSEFRREFFDEFGMSEQRLSQGAKISKEVYLKASAWYAATYTCEENWEQLQEKRLLGLPWIVDDIMSVIKCQQQSPLFIQSLDVNAAVGESLVRLFDEEKTQLLEQIKERVRVKNLVEAHLQSFKQNLSIYFSGISRTMLFHHNSNIELCVLSNKDCHASKDIEAERNILEPLACQLKAKADVEKTGDKEIEHLFYEVRLQNKNHFPILRCKKPTEKLTTATQCSSNLVCDLSASKVSILVAMLLFSFVERNPHLLLILRVIHRWCNGTGLLRNPADAENISNVLNILFLSQCINRCEIESFQADEVQQMLDRLVRGQGTDVNLCTKFEEIWNVVGYQTNNEQTEGNINLTNLGRNLLLFFQSHETSLDMIIPEPFARILTSKKVSQLIEVGKVDLIQDHMQRAYQLLAQYGDVEIMLASSSSEDYNVIFLSPLLSFSVSGVEKSKAKEIATKTGATSVVIRSSLPRSRKSAVLEVRGNEPTIRAVQRELENMTVQASRDKSSLMSGCFVDGANLMLFEGSKNVKDAITLTPYIGRCHQTHDGLPRHLAFVKNPTIPVTQYMFSRFTEKFLQQVQVLERDFVPQLHGIYELAVHFGRKYLFNVPHILLEDSESVSIAMLRANKLKTGIEQTKRSAPATINYVSQETERHLRRKRRPNKQNKSDEKKKKRKRGKPSRSSFYTIVHSEDRVKNFLQSHGFQAEDADFTETYLVNIYREDIEFYVKFDCFLKFTEVRFPNLRWCVTDIKRMWQSHVNRCSCGHCSDELLQDAREYRCCKEILECIGKFTFEGKDVECITQHWDYAVVTHRTVLETAGAFLSDKSGEKYHKPTSRTQDGQNEQDGQREDQQLILDGRETDIRFLLQSRATLKPDEISDTNYKQYINILKPAPSAEKPFIVDENLWKDVRIIRFTKCRKFKACADVQNEFLSTLTVYLNEVEEHSRPCENSGQFKTKIPRWEVSFKTELPEDFGTKATLKNFLSQIWDFAFALSTYVSE